MSARTLAAESARTRQLLDPADVRRAVTRIAHEIVERNRGAAHLAILGIRTRGVPLARRLASRIAEIEGVKVPLGVLDVRAFRDDVAPGDRPSSETRIEFDLTGRRVVLVDEVLYTGRTVRAAMDALLEFGRPEQVQLAVLVDRGHRELPIRPDFVGKNLPTARHEYVRVYYQEVDGQEGVALENSREPNAKGRGAV